MIMPTSLPYQQVACANAPLHPQRRDELHIEKQLGVHATMQSKLAAIGLCSNPFRICCRRAFCLGVSVTIQYPSTFRKARQPSGLADAAAIRALVQSWLWPLWALPAVHLELHFQHIIAGSTSLPCRAVKSLQPINWTSQRPADLFLSWPPHEARRYSALPTHVYVYLSGIKELCTL